MAAIFKPHTGGIKHADIRIMIPNANEMKFFTCGFFVGVSKRAVAVTDILKSLPG
jgi:hypothetical protein